MSTFTAADHAYMAKALQLAEQGRYTTHPNPRVGCVIVKDDQIVGEGAHLYAGEPHAEVHALRQASEQAKGATAYVTLEPCSHFGRTPPCANALIDAGVSRVVVAMQDPNPQVAGRGLKRLQEAGVKVVSGLMEQAARELNVGFISQMERQRPYMRVKLAMSLDGRTAMQSGESKWITGEAARHDVQYLRAQAGAVLTGIGTVLADDPSLNVRLEPQDLGVDRVRQPKRVILDCDLQCPRDARLLTLAGETLIYTQNNDQQRIQALTQAGAMVRYSADLSLPHVMQMLVEDGINEVHVEAGAKLCGALVEQGLADELVIYVAPHLMGSDARGLLNLPFTQMNQRIDLDIQDIRAVGKDWRITARPRG